MLVEPASLCWLAGRRAEARDGVTRAAELERWPALRAVVRDGGSGLSKGIELVRARRRVQQGADLEDSLDVVHTLREGGRALETVSKIPLKDLAADPRHLQIVDRPM